MEEAEQDLSAFAISARAQDLAFVRAVLEASEGLGVITGTRDGDVRVLTPRSRRAELAQLLDDLSRERGFSVLDVSAASSAAMSPSAASSAANLELEERRGIR